MLYQPGQREPVISPSYSFSWQRFTREWLRPLLTVIVIGVVVNLFFPRYYVQGHSMEPQIHEADWLFTSNLDALTNSIRRGDIVVLVSPHDDELAVKRVIGLPGEQVNIHEGQVYIDYVPLHEDYIEEAPGYYGEWVIGPDEYFVLGDNRNRSLDSADYGPVEASRIRGAVKLRLWPLTDFGVLTLPDYTRDQPQ